MGECLEKYRLNYIRCGTYLLICSLRPRVLLTLIRRISKILEPQRQIQLKVYEDVLNSLGQSMNTEELLCSLAFLISKGWINAYISHQHKIIVLDKNNYPFPKAAEKD